MQFDTIQFRDDMTTGRMIGVVFTVKVVIKR